MKTNKFNEVVEEVMVKEVVELDLDAFAMGYMEMAAISLNISSEGFYAENEAEETTNNFLY